MPWAQAREGSSPSLGTMQKRVSMDKKFGKNNLKNQSSSLISAPTAFNLLSISSYPRLIE